MKTSIINLFFCSVFFIIISCNANKIDLSSGEVMYQDFEVQPSDWWAWDVTEDKASVALSSPGEPYYRGKHSLKLISAIYDATGDYTKYIGTGFPSQTSAWDIDLNPLFANNQIVFWAYAVPNNGADGSISIRLYDINHTTDSDCQFDYDIPTKALYKKWTKITIPFSTIQSWVSTTNPNNAGKNLNLHHINKIQFQFAQGGTYFLDEIKANNSTTSDRDENNGYTYGY